MTHLWIRRTISGRSVCLPGAVPCRCLQPAACWGSQTTLRKWVQKGHCTPILSQISPDYDPQRLPVARDVVQSQCTCFSSVLTLSALRPGLLYRGSLLGASANRQETESFTVCTHCLPGANFEQKKTLFISFIYKSRALRFEDKHTLLLG